MLFSDKLVFLMDLTGTSNLMLAEAIKTSPTQVSLMRTGRRGRPQKTQRLERLAEYFALKSTTDYHRAALADIIGQQQIKLMHGAPELTLVLHHWLSGTNEQPGDRAEQFLHEMSSFYLQPAGVSPGASGTPPFERERRKGNQNYVYYGNDGRRDALQEFLRFLYTLESPCEVLVSSDENVEWILESPSFAREMAKQMLGLTDRGFSCRRIAAPLLSADAAFDSLSRWLPLYLTGQIHSYYYPRLRDDLYRSTIFAVPGKMALVSISLGEQTQMDATLLVTDKSLVGLIIRRFEALFERCKPMTTTYGVAEGARDLRECLLRFEGYPGSYIRRSASLSAITTPPSLQARLIATGSAHMAWRRDAFLKGRALFESNVANDRCVDIMPLARVEDVLAGRVPICLSYLFNEEPVFYTAQEYVAHLRYLLELLDRWKNYVVVLEENQTDAYVLYVKERQSATLIRTQQPFTVFEVAEPNTVAACYDYLNRIAAASLKNSAWKQRVIFQIREAISLLEQHL